MSKLTLSSILSSYSSASKLNNNFDLIESAFDNTLSRDGTSPNSMAADLDMDSNSVINLPLLPTLDHEATSKSYVDDTLSGVEGLSNLSNVAGTGVIKIVGGTVQVRTEHDVKLYGAIGDGVTNDTSAITAAMTAAGTGGIVVYPPGTYLVAELSITADYQVHYFLPGAKFKLPNSSSAAMVRIHGNYVQMINAELDGNISNNGSHNGGGIVLYGTDTRLENINLYNHNTFGISNGATAIPERWYITGRVSNCKYICIFIDMPESQSQEYEGGYINIFADQSMRPNVSPYGSCVIIHGDETNNKPWKNVTLKGELHGIEDVADSTANCCEVRCVRDMVIDLKTTGGGMGISCGALYGNGGGVIHARSPNAWGIELGGPCENYHFSGSIDGRNASTGTPDLAAAILIGSATTSTDRISWNGSIRGVTGSGANGALIYKNGGAHVVAQGIFDCDGADYILFDRVDSGSWSLSGTFIAGSTGKSIALVSDTSGNGHISGQILGAWQHSIVEIDTTTSKTTDHISIDGNCGPQIPPYTTSLAGGGALGVNVSCNASIKLNTNQYATYRDFKNKILDGWSTAGSPETVVTAGIGSTWRRFDGGASTSFYIKESGTGNTGWVGK